MIYFWELLKKIIGFLQMIGVDNEKIYNYLYPKIKEFVIKSVELENQELEETIEHLINSVVDLILKTLLGIDDDGFHLTEK